MIDSHVHLNLRDFDKDRDAVIERALEAGVTAMVNIGFDLDSSRASLDLASRYRCIYGAAGVHPHDATSYTDEVERELEALFEHSRMIAVGETGLDYYRDLSPRDVQMRVFKRQLALARRLGKPVIIHCRDAFDDVVEVLEEEGGHRGIFHAFSGDTTMARRVLELGFRLGIGGVATFKNSNLREVLAAIPPESIVLETDCPWLAPVPFRGKRNEPAHLQYVLPVVAAAQGVSPDDIVRTTSRTFRDIMGLAGGDQAAIVYKIRDSLYINMTNRCTNRCVFCTREERPVVRGHNLGLAVEPGAQEILAEIGDRTDFGEIVFCGYGEPTVRLQELITVATALKERGIRVRLNTNGTGNLFWKRNILPELAPVVDVVSVSLNTSDEAEYRELCRPAFGEAAFPAVVDFVRRSVAAGIDTVCTAVEYPGVDIEAAERLAVSLGARFRARAYNILG